MTTTENHDLISAKIVSLLNEGLDVREAFNTVLGAGAYEKNG